MDNTYNDDYGTASAGNTVPRTMAFKFNGLQVKFFKAKDPGTVALDLLQRPDNTMGFKYKVHSGVGPQNNHDVVCPKQYGGRCPICDMQENLHEEAKQNLMASGMEEERAWKEAWKNKNVKALFPKDRIVYNLVDPSDRNAVMLMDVSGANSKENSSTIKRSVESKIQSAAIAYKTRKTMPIFKYGDPVQGATLVATFQESEFPGNGGKMVKFMEWANLYFEPRDKPLDPSILDKVIMVEKYLNTLNYEQIEELFYGTKDSVQIGGGDYDEIVSSPEPTPAPQPVAPPKEEPKVPNPCPSGYRYGVDNDTKAECEDCDLFTQCRKEKKRIIAEGDGEIPF